MEEQLESLRQGKEPGNIYTSPMFVAINPSTFLMAENSKVTPDSVWKEIYVLN